MTIYEIKRRVANAPYFFSRENMAFAHQTLRDFRVRKMADGRYLVTAPARDSRGRSVGETRRIFDPETNRLEHEED